MRGRVLEVVIYFKFHENRSRGLGAVGVENRPLPLTRPMASITASNTAQTVILSFDTDVVGGAGWLAQRRGVGWW